MSGNGSGEAARTPGQAMVPAAGRNIAVRREGAMAAGAVAVGAVALGAMAVGALAIGRLAIGRLALRRLALGRAGLSSGPVGHLRLAQPTIEDLRVIRVRQSGRTRKP